MKRLWRVIIAMSSVVSTVFVSEHPATVSAKRQHRVIIVGDSVFSVLRWAPATQEPLWRHGYDITNESWGCQSLMTAGCPGSGGKSTLERLAAHKDEAFDAVIVGTGYNDVGPATIRTAMSKIAAFARQRATPVLWATYLEGGNMKRKAHEFNRVLRAQASHHPNVAVLEWSNHAVGHRSWFNGDSVHLNGTGGRQLARFLASALDDYFAEFDGE